MEPNAELRRLTPAAHRFQEPQPMWRAFDKAMERFAELEKLLSDQEVVSNHVRYTKLAKELGSVSKLVHPYKEFKKVEEELAQAQTMREADDDEEMQAFVEDEIATLQAKKKALTSRMEDLLLTAGEDYSSIIMEIRAGTGGDEAALFAGDLFEMYSYYARDHGWKIETISFSPGEQGGFKEIVFSVNGDDVYQQFQYEGGGHRVQRVPKTETQGRVHTSAATVAVLPEPDEVQVHIKDDDLEWERMRAGGAGGQHVNKTESAVRIWYKRGTPEELEVKCQDERSQHKNRERAMRILRSRIFERQKEAAHQQRAEQRRIMVGSGDRSQRIRTYNFPQNRLTDHRINLTLYKLDAIIAGDMSELITSLKDQDKRLRLEQSGDDA